MKKYIILIFSIIIVSSVYWYDLNNSDYLNIINLWNKIQDKTKLNNTILNKIKNKVNLRINAEVNEKKLAYYKELVKLIDIYIIFSEKKTLKWPFKVTKVVDWDTININYNNKNKSIRMIWIDAPESTITRYGYLECWWKESTQELKSKLENKFIYIELDESQWIEDKYWRLLAYIRLDWININYSQIEKWNWSEYTYKNKYKYKDLFLTAEFYGKRLKRWMRNDMCNWKNKTDNKIETTQTKIISQNCWNKKYCSEMSNCEEAQKYLNECNLSKLDADWDWIPCESICK